MLTVRRLRSVRGVPGRATEFGAILPEECRRCAYAPLQEFAKLTKKEYGFNWLVLAENHPTQIDIFGRCGPISPETRASPHCWKRHGSKPAEPSQGDCLINKASWAQKVKEIPVKQRDT